MITRRKLLVTMAGTTGAALTALPGAVFGQGVSSRGVKPQPRGKPSGRPFLARFTDVAKQAGLTQPIIYGAVENKSYIIEVVGCGVAFIDYDNDGWLDLLVLNGTRLEGAPPGTTNRLYKNNRDGTFTDVTERAGLTRTGWASAVTVGDYDNDGFDDLFITGYGSNMLYRNNGDGTFTDVSRKSGVGAASGSYPMTAVAADLDNDGWPDIYVACDSTPSWLFRNQHDGTFREEALERGVALSEDGLEQAGMGIAVGDCDLDGNLDIFKTNFADDTNVLYRNDGKGNFDDVTIRSGLGVETRYVGWGTGIVDLDNDGFPDLFIATGSVYPEVEKKLPSYPFRTPRLVFRNLGDGRFEELIEEAGSGVSALHASRGCAFEDFDNDGDMDILVMNMNEPPTLLRYDVSGGGHWLKVLLVGVKSNRSAIGARVTAHYGNRRQAQEVLAQSSFYSANDRRLHFGLGVETAADLTIRWPNGTTETISRVAADQLVVIREGTGVIRKQKF